MKDVQPASQWDSPSCWGITGLESLEFGVSVQVYTYRFSEIIKMSTPAPGVAYTHLNLQACDVSHPTDITGLD